MVYLWPLSSLWHVMTNEMLQNASLHGKSSSVPWQQCILYVILIKSWDWAVSASQCFSTWNSLNLVSAPEPLARLVRSLHSRPITKLTTATVFTIILSCNLDRHRFRRRVRHGYVNSAQVATWLGIHHILRVLYLLCTRSWWEGIHLRHTYLRTSLIYFVWGYSFDDSAPFRLSKCSAQHGKRQQIHMSVFQIDIPTSTNPVSN